MVVGPVLPLLLAKPKGFVLSPTERASSVGLVKKGKIQAVWSEPSTESPCSAGFVRMEELVVSDTSILTPGEEQAAAKVAPAGHANKRAQHSL